jgi:hypothetical protein
MANDMSIKEKFIYRLSSEVRTTKTHRREFIDTYRDVEGSSKFLTSGFLGFLD